MSASSPIAPALEISDLDVVYRVRGRDRQVLLDYHPGVRVILPTSEGIRSVTIEDLMPLATVWSIQDGSQTR